MSVLNDRFVNDIGIYFLNNDSLKIKDFNELGMSKFPDFNKCDSINDTVKSNAFIIKLKT